MIIPQRNIPDVKADLPAAVRDALEIISVQRLEEVSHFAVGGHQGRVCRTLSCRESRLVKTAPMMDVASFCRFWLMPLTRPWCCSPARGCEISVCFAVADAANTCTRSADVQRAQRLNSYVYSVKECSVTSLSACTLQRDCNQ